MTARASAPGFPTSSTRVRTSLPSHPTSSPYASPISSRSVGLGGTFRGPQWAQKRPASSAPQLRQVPIGVRSYTAASTPAPLLPPPAADRHPDRGRRRESDERRHNAQPAG